MKALKIEAGDEFGYLIAIEPDRSSGRLKWLCVCECGNEKTYYPNHLVHKKVKSCGCKASNLMQGNKNHAWTGYKDIYGKQYLRVKQNAERRNIDFSLSIEDLQELWEVQNKKCVYSGIELIPWKKSEDNNSTMSLDRIDSKIGYIKNNIQWVHKDINNMKMGLDEKTFLDFCCKIAKNTGCV